MTMRQAVHAPTSTSGPQDAVAGDRPRPSPAAGGALRLALRLIVAPVAVLAAAAAGLLFAVLLPICGIATIAEGVAKASWRFARDTLAHLPRPSVRRS